MKPVPVAVEPPGADCTDRFRTLMSLFPTGVSVVTAVDGLRRPRGMTCTSLASVTLQPPTLLVCLQLTSATAEAVVESRGFAVNVLDARARSIAQIFSGPVPDRFERVRWVPGRSGMPLLMDGALATGECLVSRVIEVGDHAVVLGEVVHVTTAEGRPLLYGMRQFGAWATLASPVGPE